ncbi:nucleotide sugar dehydrogenase [Blastococcus saxobsidens]|uniref:UDP-glucose 6-dehydrogenase n=1 Tax=Blastococcus saxobsidens (strain DD2) TaxID=1146883 RepID=H6RN38_BLASD|nr:nucleotide sugar dehydrogenase [Blastococcus saxobsidens]CCG01391.1 GDP-mannose 6-dehydrogenase [Blastococcus saxobsidens DD2]
MKVAVFGLGYVGMTAAACMVKQGHVVVGIDVSEAKVSTIRRGKSPIMEPGVQEQIAEGIDRGTLSATTSPIGVLDDADLAIVCVGTPSAPDGGHNMTYIAEVSRQIAANVGTGRTTPLTVAYRSTVRPGTMEELVWPIFQGALGDDIDAALELVYNPEFLRESSGMRDYFEPPKVVVGTRDGRGSDTMLKLYADVQAPWFDVPFREAELTKFVDNTWHAVKVAYANELGRICQQMGISASAVSEIFLSDTKLNISARYLRPGGPFGGSCLPKDVRALQRISADVGANTHLIDALIRSNESHKYHQFQDIRSAVSPGDRILLCGLTFKAHTDDVRESPAIDLARMLITDGCLVEVYDPYLEPAALVGQNLGYAYSHLPQLSSLLVSAQHAESQDYALVVDTNGTASDLQLSPDQPVVSTNRIA